MSHHMDKWADQLADLVLSAGPADELLTDEQMAKASHVHPQFFRKLRSRGLGPTSVRISRRVVRTPRAAWADWLRERAASRDAAD